MTSYHKKLPTEKIKKTMEKAADVFEISRDFMAGSLKITLLGDYDLCLEGNLIIIEYSDIILRVAASNFIITVEGKNLEVSEIDGNFLHVCGNFTSLSYLK